MQIFNCIIFTHGRVMQFAQCYTYGYGLYQAIEDVSGNRPI